MQHLFHTNLYDLEIARGIRSQSFWAQNTYRGTIISQIYDTTAGISVSAEKF